MLKGSTPSDSGGARQTDPLTTVVIDDAPEMVSLLRTVLARDPRFDLVADGDDGLQAVRLAQQHQPRLILVDISMPRMDGIAAAARIRVVSPATCVVIYTGHDDPGLAEQARKAGAAGFLSKATPIEALTDDLARVVAAHDPVASGEQGRDSGEQLRQSEERFRLLVEAVEDYAIFMLDPAGLIVSWNSGAERIKGYTASEIIGRHFRVFYPEDKQLAGHPEYELVQALSEGHFEEEGWRVRKDGSLMWANVLITPVYDERGKHLGFAKVTRDITERRKHQQEREAAAQSLADLNVELGRANQVLVATAEQRADFLAVTAHELRTPISVISGSANALSTYWEELDKAEREDLLGTISTSAARLSRLLDDLQTAARLESGSMDLTLGPVRVNEVLEAAVSAARVHHGSDAPRLQTLADVTVRADRDRLAQAVDNLVQNAYRHGRPPVRIVLRDHEGVAEIRVSDAGDGVPGAAQARLFERYVTGGRRKGTGLGLFIVRELARAQGGDAWWEESTGDDDAFVIGLPVASGEQ